jgi:hypothetical protein
MTATPSAIGAFASLNIGKKINEGIFGWFLEKWNSLPFSHWPAWMWMICVSLVFAYVSYWIWFHFIR